MSGQIRIPVLPWENLSGLAIAAFEVAGNSCQVSHCDAHHVRSATDLNHYKPSSFSSATNIVKTTKDTHHVDRYLHGFIRSQPSAWSCRM